MRVFAINQSEPIKFLICGNLCSSDQFLHIKRNFNDNVLIIVQKGQLHINTNGKAYSVKENQYVLLKAGEEHFGFKKSVGELSYFWIHFSTVSMEDYTSFNKDCTKALQNKYIFAEYGTLLYSNRINLLFHQLMDFSMDKSFYNKSILDYLCSVILLEVSNQFLTGQTISTKINPITYEICNWIKRNYNHQFSVEELSEINGYKSEYLSKLFKKNMKVSILQYTNQLRIDAAKQLLPSFSIKETAYSCGFEDEKYFMKVFKKLVGITPTEYKNAFYKKNIN